MIYEVRTLLPFHDLPLQLHSYIDECHNCIHMSHYILHAEEDARPLSCIRGETEDTSVSCEMLAPSRIIWFVARFWIKGDSELDSQLPQKKTSG